MPPFDPRAPLDATTSEALAIANGGSGGGGTSLWCACKLDCDNAGTVPILTKLCKDKCDTDNKCRKGVIGFGGGSIFAE